MSKSRAHHQSDEAQVEAVRASDVEASPQGDDRTSLDEQIRMRAYELYRQRGGRNGDDINDWLRAESEFLGRHAESPDRLRHTTRGDVS